jgi:hypothetical protein
LHRLLRRRITEAFNVSAYSGEYLRGFDERAMTSST